MSNQNRVIKKNLMFFQLFAKFFFAFLVTPICATSLSNIASCSPQDIIRKKQTRKISNTIKENGVVFIHGFGGMGKSKLAKIFACEHHKKYEIIWWIDGKKDILNQIEDLTKEVYKKFGGIEKIPSAATEDVLIKELNDFSKKKKLKILLIFDSLEEHNCIKKIINITPNKSIHFIITTRKSSFFNSDVNICSFDPNESLQLLKKIIPFYSEKELKNLAETLNNYPLAVAQSAYFLAQNKAISVQDYILKYKTNLKKLWEREEQLISSTEQQEKSVRTTVRICLKEIATKNHIEKNLLILLSVINNQNIPHFFIFEVGTELGFKKEEIEDAISILLKHNFISFSNNNIVETRSYNIHEIIQLSILNESNNKEKSKILNTLYHYIFKQFSNNKNLMISFCKKNTILIEHAIKSLDIIKKFPELSTISAKIKIFILDYLIYIKRYHRKALILIDDIIPELNKIHDQILYARFLSSAGDVLSLHRQEDPKTKAYFLEIKKIIEQKLINDPYELVRLQNSIAQNLLLKTRAKEAEKYTSLSLNIIENFNEPELKLPTYYFTSWAACDLGDYEKSLKYANMAIFLFTHGYDTPIKFYMYNLKALAYIRLKQYKNAYDASLIAIKNCYDYFGTDITDTLAEALSYKAAAELNLYGYKQALKTINTSIALYDIFYKNQDKATDQGFAYMIKGDCLLFAHDYMTAQALYIKGFKIVQKLQTEKKSIIFKKIILRMIYTLKKMKKHNISNMYCSIFNKDFPNDNISQITETDISIQDFFKTFG